MPRSRPARWALILMVGSAWLFAAFFALVISGQKGGDTFFSNPWLAGTITAGAGTAILAALLSIYSIIRERERSVSVFVTTALGLLVLAYAILELAFPH